MKKFLLALSAVALTAGAASAANAFYLYQRTFVPHKITAQAATWQPAQMAQAPAKATAKTVNDIVGSYLYTAQSYDGKESETGSVSISKVSNDTVQITGLLGTTLPVKAGLSGSTLTIPYGQVIYTSTSYGNCVLTRFGYEGTEFYYYSDGNITATVQDDGSIAMNDYIGIVISSGQYQGYSLGNILAPFTLQRPNGELVSTDVTNGENDTVAVNINQVSRDTVKVDNFANFGNTVTFVLKSDSTFTIAKQLVYDGGSTYGQFYTQKADFTKSGATKVADYVAGDTISGKGDAKNLVWDQWIILSEQYYLGAYATGKLTYLDESTFIYPDKSNGVADAFADKQAVSKTYYNLAGMQAAQPFDGVNIVVTRYSDGTSKAVKQIIR